MTHANLFRRAGVIGGLAATLMTAACRSHAPPVGNSTTSNLTTPSALSTSAAPPAAPAAQKNWFDLQVGDCLGKVPQVDLGEVTVPVVDCATPHPAEVYLRAPVEVDAAIADVADQKCDAAVTDYTGQPAGDGHLVVTYLIDSNQDRTVADPLPSTVICLLQSANGQPVTGSARR